MANQAFAYLNLWARNDFDSIVQEYGLTDELMLSGSVSIPADKLQSFVDYITDPANMTEYGVKLDAAVFYDSYKKVPFSGSIKVPYKKEEATTKREPASTRAKRQV